MLLFARTYIGSLLMSWKIGALHVMQFQAGEGHTAFLATS